MYLSRVSFPRLMHSWLLQTPRWLILSGGEKSILCLLNIGFSSSSLTFTKPREWIHISKSIFFSPQIPAPVTFTCCHLVQIWWNSIIALFYGASYRMRPETRPRTWMSYPDVSIGQAALLLHTLPGVLWVLVLVENWSHDWMFLI